MRSLELEVQNFENQCLCKWILMHSLGTDIGVGQKLRLCKGVLVFKGVLCKGGK